MNQLTVRILEVTPAVVKFNYDEMKIIAQEIKEQYEGRIFTEETVKDGKSTVAEIRKIQKSINDFKVKTKKELTASVSEFETQCKDIISDFDEPLEFITKQLEEFERRRIEAKSDEIHEFIRKQYTDFNMLEKFQTIHFRDEWLNVTKKIKDIQVEIAQQILTLKAEQDMYLQGIEMIKLSVAKENATIGVPLSHEVYVGMLSYRTVTEVIEVITKTAQNQRDQEEAYKKAVEEKAKQAAEAEAKRAIEEANRIAEAEIKRVVEEAKEQIEQVTEAYVEVTKPVEVSEKSRIQHVTLKISGTKEQLAALKTFLSHNNMGFEKVV
jgi:hypothetical protein